MGWEGRERGRERERIFLYIGQYFWVVCRLHGQHFFSFLSSTRARLLAGLLQHARLVDMVLSCIIRASRRGGPSTALFYFVRALSCRVFILFSGLILS